MKDMLQFILEEYKALRAECILCLERRVTILSYGLTAIGALTAAGIAAGTASHALPVASAFIFCVLTPSTALFVLWIWFSETRRIRRASHYLWALEIKVNRLIESSEKALEWHSQVRGAGPHKYYRDHYVYIASYFTLSCGISLCAGIAVLLFQVFPVPTESKAAWILAGGSGALLSAGTLYTALLEIRWLEAFYNYPPDAENPYPNVKRPVAVNVSLLLLGLLLISVCITVLVQAGSFTNVTRTRGPTSQIAPRSSPHRASYSTA